MHYYIKGGDFYKEIIKFVTEGMTFSVDLINRKLVKE